MKRRRASGRSRAAAPVPGRARCEELADPDIPAGTEMVTMTVREALRDAMAEEMRRDKDVFVMGEEVAEYQGAYKVTQGLLQEFGAGARHRHADHRARLRRPRRRRGAGGPEADRRIHDLQLRHAGDRPDHQFGGQDALHVRRPDGLPDRVPRAERRRRARRRPAQPGLFRLVQPGARPEGRRSPTRRPTPKGLLKAAIRDPNPVIFLENEILYGQSVRGAEARRLRAADRQGADRARRQGRHHRLLRHRHDLRAEGGRRTRRHGHRGRGHRPPHAPPDGPRHGRRVGQEDQPRA